MKYNIFLATITSQRKKQTKRQKQDQQVEGLVEQLAGEAEEQLVIDWIFGENNLDYVWLVPDFPHDDF
ncbi:hypothetical protein [Halalkalibacter krulwichiae]|uniref:hypothetical protein n=1 Tax=Halalkalibacter krulwichiae TaxID=199441 RepID=UPI00082556B8|nr:hypothetical protein [Halalkalibacter krulwichiae]